MKRLCRASIAIVLASALTWYPFAFAAGPAFADEAIAPQITQQAGAVAPLRPLRGPVGTVQAFGQVAVQAPGLAYAPAGPASTPVFAGTEVKTGKGVAILALGDGTRLHVQPGGAVTLSQAPSPVTVRIAKGTTLGFRIPATGAVILATPTAQIENPGTRLAGMPVASVIPLAGTIRVDASGATHVQMQQGEVLVRPDKGTRAQIASPGTEVTVPGPGQILVAQVEEGAAAAAAAGAAGEVTLGTVLIVAGVVGVVAGATIGGLYAAGIVGKAAETKLAASPSTP